MKLKSVLIGIITMVMLLISENVYADSTAPESFMVNGEDIYTIDTSKYLVNGGIVGYNFHYKQNSDGTVIYCVQSHNYAVTSGVQKYTLSKEMEAKFAYIINNGYPNKSFSNDRDKDYLITSFAVFYLVDPSDYIFDHFDFAKGTYYGEYSDIAVEISKLIKGANTYSYTEPSIKISGNKNEFGLSSDKKYYISSAMGVTTSGNIKKYNVSLENTFDGVIVTDVNGNVKNEYNVNEKFVIKVPVELVNELSTEYKVNVTGTGYINKAYMYEPSEDRYQNVAVLYPEYKNVSDSTLVKLNIITKVVISKQDVTTGEELSGATLTIKNVKGEVVETWVSSNEPKVIEGLEVGKYTLTEVIAPEGYELSTETIEFEVRADGTTTEVVMYNKLKDKVIIYISKQDITTGEELSGAHLEVRDSEGNVVEAWISGDTPHMIEGLKPGKYFLTEVFAPMGYELSTETVEFIVREDGTVDGDIIMYNKPETIVEVPSTSSFKTITASIIGIIVIGLGSMIIYRNYKKNEEN